MSSPSRRRPVRALALAVALASSVTLTGCTQVVDAFNALQAQTSGGGQPVVVSTPVPQSSPTAMPFDSRFTYDGSVSLSSEVADGLELRLDVWAVDPKRTMEWTSSNEKQFGFALNVHDHRVDEKAVLAQKRRVYISSVSVTSQTAQAGGQVSNPFQFSADPRTLVPSDTLRSDRGLLLNSFQGGLLVPTTSIRQLPADTYGITLEFALNIAVEGTANSDASFSQQTVYQYLPVAIFDGDSSSGSPAPAGSGTSTGRAPGWGQSGNQG